MDINIKTINKFNNATNTINYAIEECSKAGGGKVIIPCGLYICNTIRLRSNVCLYLEKGAIIKLSSNLDEFYDINIDRDTSIDAPTWENCEYDGKPSKYFIYAYNEDNISIEGMGIINGNEEIFYGNVTKYHIEGSFYPRIPLIYFEACKNFIIKGVTLTKSAFWTVHLVGCNGGLIEYIKINNNLKMTNCDGIDPDHSKNITIKNCYISSADDCIVLKSTSSAIKYGNTENIIVSDCTLTSTSAAIKIGSETEGDFNNIKFSNINIINSNRGISIQLRDKGNISNIEFNNINIETKRFSPIHWWGKAEAIAITALRRKKDSLVGMISNITFNNINTIGENGILIYGMNNINNVTFNNISVSIIRKTNWKKEGIDLRPSIYSILKGTPKVLYIRNASDILFTKLSYYVSDNMKKIVNEEVDIMDSKVIIK